MHGRNIRLGLDSNQRPREPKANTITTELKRILSEAVVSYCIQIWKQPCLMEWSPVTVLSNWMDEFDVYRQYCAVDYRREPFLG